MEAAAGLLPEPSLGDQLPEQLRRLARFRAERLVPVVGDAEPDVEPHGLIVQLQSQRIVFSGDTGWFDALPSYVAGAELFVCECTNVDPGFEYHLSLRELREHLSELDCKRLVLTHLGEEMAALRGRCEIETADDGLRLGLPATPAADARALTQPD